MKKIKYFIAVIVFIQTFTFCSSEKKWEKTPVDKLIAEYVAKPDFSIILADMNNKDNKYMHKYLIVLPEKDTVVNKETDWKEVSDEFFNKHINDLGMTIVSKKNGKLTRAAVPPGYDNYVGNTKYGRWEQRSDGSSFWSFYGKYAFMASMFHLGTRPIYRSYYDDYRSHTMGGRSYYGSGVNTFGTKTYTSSEYGRNTTWGKQPDSFKQKVRSQVKRSAKKSAVARRKSRSSSRYGSSSSRSRGGGSGK